MFSSPLTPKPAWGTTQSPGQWVPRIFPRSVLAEEWLLPTLSPDGEVKNEWNYISIPLITFFLLFSFLYFVLSFLSTMYLISSVLMSFFFYNIQHINQCPGGIRTRNSTRLTAPDLRPKPRGHRDRLSQRLLEKTFTFA
jgi:hypothetical protein